MRMRAGLLAMSLGLACVVLATESTQKSENRAPPPKENAPVVSWGHVEGPTQGQLIQGTFQSGDAENAGVENRVVFAEIGQGSTSMEGMRKQLADPQQRKAMRAEYRASLEQTYSDAEEELKLDSTTRLRLMELLADQYMESMDRMFGASRSEAWPSMQVLAGAENRKLDQLREVLGEDGLQRYQEYITSVYERGQVREVDANLGLTDKLSPEQKGRLAKLFKEKIQRGLPPPGPTRMSKLLRSHDPNSPTFKEDLQRESALATIEANEQMLRLTETSNRRMAERASEFLKPAQIAALAKVNEADLARQRKWIEQARAKAGLDPAIPERGNEASTPTRKAVSGEVTLDLVVRVDDGEPVHITNTGLNGKRLEFKASDDLFVEAEWTLYDDNWVEVRLTYFEEGPNGRRRLHGGSGFGTLALASNEITPGDNNSGARTGSSTIVTGRKAYSVELNASAAVR